MQRNEVWRYAHESHSHLEGLLESLDGSERECVGTDVTSRAVARESTWERGKLCRKGGANQGVAEGLVSAETIKIRGHNDVSDGGNTLNVAGYYVLEVEVSGMKGQEQEISILVLSGGKGDWEQNCWIQKRHGWGLICAHKPITCPALSRPHLYFHLSTSRP